MGVRTRAKLSSTKTVSRCLISKTDRATNGRKTFRNMNASDQSELSQRARVATTGTGSSVFLNVKLFSIFGLVFSFVHVLFEQCLRQKINAKEKQPCICGSFETIQL